MTLVYENEERVMHELANALISELQNKMPLM